MNYNVLCSCMPEPHLVIWYLTYLVYIVYMYFILFALREGDVLGSMHMHWNHVVACTLERRGMRGILCIAVGERIERSGGRCHQ